MPVFSRPSMWEPDESLPPDIERPPNPLINIPYIGELVAYILGTTFVIWGLGVFSIRGEEDEQPPGSDFPNAIESLLRTSSLTVLK